MKIFLPLFVLLLMGSCAMPKVTSSNSKNTEIYGAGVMQLPVVAELKVDDKKSTATVNPPKGTSVEDTKTLAIREILKKTGGDILVHPIVEYEIYKRKITLTVTGYSGTYFNFHQLTLEEVPLLEAGILQKPVEDNALINFSKNSNPKIKRIAGIAGGSLAAVLVATGLFVWFF